MPRPAAPPSASQPPKSARERLLAAARELFYAESINTVGIDRIIERAGVAKASLYDNFGSKDELVRAYLADRAASREARIEAWIGRYKTPREKILGLFDWLGDAMAQPTFRGCYFQRANAELKPEAAGRAVLGDARDWTDELITRLAREAGLPQPKKVARQVQILLDGAIVCAAMDGAPQAAATAKAMAATLIDAAG
ncbi:MAG TPA: helix-turn-helix domain-containing protein [Usitatibacter sp.]|nr:helix-turn-helix domain-containing protein [Usitatibacter sp.]